MALTAKKVYAILKRQISDMEAKLNSPVRYRGTVATADLLPLNPDIGDMYNIESKSVYGEAGMNVAWNGVVWDTMGAPIDMSLYFTKEETEAVIQRLVTEYFEKNPVKPGATTEQAQQIEQNKTDIASLKTETSSLKESISTKITKFYASSQGETHLADSDDGKIMDMMLYGRSEQKRYSGKNLIDCTLNTSTVYNATYTKLDVGGRYSVIGTPSDPSGVNFYTGTLESGTYTLSCTIESGSLPGNINVVTTDIIANCKFNNGHVSFTLQEASKIILWNDYGITYNKNLNATFAIQIEKGSTATDYEPYVGGIQSPNPDYPQEIKSVVNPTVKVSNEDETQFKTVTLPYTLNAIPVSSGGNVTIYGQQYITDYVDVERGKLVRMVDSSKLDNTQSIIEKNEWLLAEPQEIDLTREEVQTLKALVTYYPTTNISINSEQLDGYTIFNYPISFEDEWNKTQKQISNLKESKANGQGITLSINESGGLRVTYDDGK